MPCCRIRGPTISSRDQLTRMHNVRHSRVPRSLNEAEALGTFVSNTLITPTTYHLYRNTSVIVLRTLTPLLPIPPHLPHQLLLDLLAQPAKLPQPLLHLPTTTATIILIHPPSLPQKAKHPLTLFSSRTRSPNAASTAFRNAPDLPHPHHHLLCHLPSAYIKCRRQSLSLLRAARERERGQWRLRSGRRSGMGRL